MATGIASVRCGARLGSEQREDANLPSVVPVFGWRAHLLASVDRSNAVVYNDRVLPVAERRRVARADGIVTTRRRSSTVEQRFCKP